MASVDTSLFIAANKRSVIMPGMAADRFYDFAVRAYRKVDSDIEASGVIYSPLTPAKNLRYQPSVRVSFNGNITGTIMDVAASQVIADIKGMTADNVLSRVEKPQIALLLSQMLASNKAQDAKAQQLGGIDRYRDAATTALNEWVRYLNALDPAYNDLSKDTPIDGAEFQTKYAATVSALADLDAMIIERAAQKAEWDQVVGDNKPDDNATEGAPPGTNVGGRPVEDILDDIDASKEDIKAARAALLSANLIKLIQKPIDDLAALQLSYGKAGLDFSHALSKKNLTAIRELGTRIDENGDKIAEEFLQLTARLSDAEKALAGIDVEGAVEAGMAELRQVIVNANKAEALATNTKIANFGKIVSAWQIEEERVRSTKDSALAEDIEKMGVTLTREVGEKIEKLEGTFNDLRELTIEDGEAVAKRLDEMGTRITTEVDGVKTAYEGAIQTIEETRARDGQATAERIDTISSSVDGILRPDGTIDQIYGTIQNAQKTQADDNGARAEETKNLQSRLDNFNGASLEQQFSTYADRVDGIGAQYVLKVQTNTNGVLSVAGMGLISENGASAIAFQADALRIDVPDAGPVPVFTADRDGVYMPNVRVDKLKAGAIDFEFLNRQSLRDPNFGYQALPGGLIMMWGRYRAFIRQETTFSVLFPAVFPNACLSFTATPYLNFFDNERDLWIQIVGQPGVSGATVATQAARSAAQNLDGFDWMAFGY